jgi:5-methylcytosine-specific restriction endonuclease McrA
MKEKEDRPAIPQPIQRQVRQECRFGCALCGKPVFHYDHIIEYNIVKEHKAENLVLLCEEHHGAKQRESYPLIGCSKQKGTPLM